MKKALLLLAFIGFAGALPMTLIGSVLSVRLKEGGFDVITIGLLSLFHFPFALKPLLAPLVERWNSPIPRVGRREGWLIFSLAITAFSISGIAFFPSHPFFLLLISGTSGLLYVAGLQVEISLASSVGRMEASAAVVAGYRIGLLVGGAGTLLLAEGFGWELAYLTIGALLLIPVLLNIRLPHQESRNETISFASPLKDLLKKGLPLLFFVLFYKIGDDIAGPMLLPYFLDMGFDKVDIAQFSKGLGMAATLLGATFAGFARRWPYPLLTFGLLHALSFLSFSLLTTSPWSLACCIFLEHFSGGLMITAFIATLWREVSPAYATTQYALLWSLLALKRSVMASTSGLLVTFLGWPAFFLLISSLSILGTLFSLPLETKRSAKGLLHSKRTAAHS